MPGHVLGAANRRRWRALTTGSGRFMIMIYRPEGRPMAARFRHVARVARVVRRAILLSGAVLLGVAAPPTAVAAAIPARTGHVILVDWDGFDLSYLDRAPMPHLDALRRRGTLSVATGTYRAISNPNRTSLATGAFPATHHNSAYVYDPVANVITRQSRVSNAETITQSLTRQGRTVAAAGW